MVPEPPNASVVVIEDDALFLHVVVRMLARYPDLTCVGEAADGTSAVPLVRLLKPDVALIDLELPKLNGLQVIDRLTDLPTRCVLMSSRLDEGHRQAAAALGAEAVHKRDGLRVLLEAVRRAARLPSRLGEQA